jgi:drug/metabolite transporter (DMT)-like permease
LRAGLALALAGSALIALVDVVGWENGRFFLLTPTAASANAARPLLGNGLALLGALSAAGYLIIGRRLRPTLSLLSYTSLVYGTAALFLLLAVALSPAHGMGGYSPRAYLFLALLALFPQLIGHSSYNWALGYLPAAYVAIAVISEPVGATLLALFIFGEIPGTLTLLGGVLILGGVYYAGR